MASSVPDRGRLLTSEEVQRVDLKKEPGPLSIFGALDEKRAPCRKQSAQHLAGNQSHQRARHYNPLGPHFQAQEKDFFSPCRYLGPFPSPPRAPQPEPRPERLQEDGWFLQIQEKGCCVLLICPELVFNMKKGCQAFQP